jgi:hypothetical protein
MNRDDHLAPDIILQSMHGIGASQWYGPESEAHGKSQDHGQLGG